MSYYDLKLVQFVVYPMISMTNTMMYYYYYYYYVFINTGYVL